MQIGAAGRQRTAVVVDHPDLDLPSRFLGCSRCRAKYSSAAITPPVRPVRLPKDIAASLNELYLLSLFCMKG